MELHEKESENNEQVSLFLSNCKHLFYFIPHVFCCNSLGVSGYHKERALRDVNCIICLCCNCKSYRRPFFGSPAFTDGNPIFKNPVIFCSSVKIFLTKFLIFFSVHFSCNKKMKLTCGARVRLGLHLPF